MSVTWRSPIVDRFGIDIARLIGQYTTDYADDWGKQKFSWHKDHMTRQFRAYYYLTRPDTIIGKMEDNDGMKYIEITLKRYHMIKDNPHLVLNPSTDVSYRIRLSIKLWNMYQNGR